MKEISKKIELSLEDIKKYSLANAYEGKVYLSVVCVLFLIFIMIAAPEVLGSFIWLIFFIVVIQLVLPVVLIFNSKKMYKESAFIKKAAVYLIDEEKITVTYDDKSCLNIIKWSEVKKVNFFEEYVLIFINSIQCFVIPLRYFSIEELNTLREIVFVNEKFKKQILKSEKKKARSIYIALIAFIIFVIIALFYMLMKFNLIF